MANTILHKRSATPSAVPLVGDLDLGELAINTNDGKLYLKKNDGVDAIVEVGGFNGIIDDTTPQLGGDLDVNGFNIIGADSATVDGGTITLLSGSSTAGAASAGTIDITGGTATGVAQAGGHINLTGGAATQGPGGIITLTPGTGGTGAEGYVAIMPSAGSSDGGELRFFEAPGNGTTYLAIKAPASMTQIRSWYLPTNTPTDGYYLKMGAGSQAEWAEFANVFTEDTFGIRAGLNAGLNLTTGATGNFFVGTQAGYRATTMDDSVAIGVDTLLNATTATRSIAIGREAMEGVNGSNLTGFHNIGIGYRAAQGLLTTSTRNTIVGATAGDSLGTVNDNTLFGYNALTAATTGNSNTAVGSNTGSSITGTAAGNVLIGYAAGPSTVGSTSNKLYINNAASDTPLIYGDFSTSDITINGNFEVTLHSYYDAVVANTTAVAIDWTDGNIQSIAPTAAGNPTYTFTAPAGPTKLNLVATNLGAAGTVTWPATVKWPGGTEPTWTAAGTDVMEFVYDGTNYHLIASSLNSS